LKKGSVCLYLLLFLFLSTWLWGFLSTQHRCILCYQILRIAQMQTKQQSALKIGKKLEGDKTASWVEVSLYF
jgi:hypothetical protein